jgi:hypothetical protein
MDQDQRRILEKRSLLASKDKFFQLTCEEKHLNIKNEMNYSEQIGVEKQIEDHFKPILRKMGVNKTAEDFLGYVYTSTGKYAEFGPTAFNFYLTEKDYINSFVLDEYGYIVIITWDKEENEKYWRMEEEDQE